MDRLTEAVEHIDLPSLVSSLWPESGARPGRAGVCRAVWRGDRNPSLSLFVARGMWFWKDHATGESGNAFHLLLVAGYDKQSAVRILKGAEGLETPRPVFRAAEKLRPAPKGLSKKGLWLLRKMQEELDQAAITGRGITLEQARRVGLGRSKKGDLAIPILGPDGKPQAVKLRLRERQNGLRYLYLEGGLGNPIWYCPGYGQPERPVLAVEGELNAIAVWSTLEEVGWKVDVLGSPGVGGRLPWEGLRGRRVYLLVDDDPAGGAALQRWQQESREKGVEVQVVPPLPQQYDACEYASERGRGALAVWIGRALGLIRPGGCWKK